MKKTVTCNLSSHSLRLCTSLSRMCKDGRFCDVVLRCGDKSFQTHSNVLAAQSEYFNEILDKKKPGPGNRQLTLNLQIDPQIVSIVLDFIYTGNAEFSQDQTEEIMKTAEVLRLAPLYNCCKENLLETINPSNFFSLWTLADSFSDDRFRQSVVDYTVENFYLLSEGQNFLRLSLAQMKMLLSSEEIGNFSQDRILEAIVMWVKANKSERESFLSSLLAFVQFERLTKSYLQVLFEQETILWESSELIKHIAKTVCTRYLHGVESFSSTECSGNSPTTDEETEPAIAVVGESEDKRVIIQYYNVEQDDWCPPEELPLQLSNMAVVEYRGLIYLIGGKRGGRYVKTLYSYNVVDSKLREEPSMMEERSHAGVAEIYGHIYVVGGYNDSGFLRTVECYNPIKEQWMRMTPLRQGRCGVAVANCNRRLYAVGGRAECSTVPVSTVEYLDLDVGQWTEVTSMPTGRSHCGICVFNQKIYIIGGFSKDDDPAAKCLQCFNPAEKTWQVYSTPLQDEWVSAAISVGKNLYITTDGGQVLKFNPDTHAWLNSSSLPTVVGYYISAVLVQKPVWDA